MWSKGRKHALAPQTMLLQLKPGQFERTSLLKRNALLLCSCHVLLHLNLVQGAKASDTYGSSKTSMVEKNTDPKGSGALHGLIPTEGYKVVGALSAKDKGASSGNVSKEC